VGSFTTSARDIAGGTILLLFLFGPAAAGFTYCVSFLFKSPSACNTFVIVLNFFCWNGRTVGNIYFTYYRKFK